MLSTSASKALHVELLKYRAGRWLAQQVMNYKAKQYQANKPTTEDSNMADLGAIFTEMKNRFNAGAAAGLDVVFQYQIEGGEPYYVSVANDSCDVAQGEHDSPSVTLSMDADTLQEVMSGETDGMQAFMAGRIRADGDIMLATRLAALFPVA